jgi:hypothetical protein
MVPSSENPVWSRHNLEASGRATPPPSIADHWWARDMDEEQYERYIQLVQQIEAIKGESSSHARECAVRYSALEGKISEVRSSIDVLRGSVTATRTVTRKWVDAILCTTIFVLFTFSVWSAAQLYATIPHH